MDIRITPSKLKGSLSVPASKSCAHRSIICASLADGVSHLSGVTMSKDIEATIGAMTALGAEFEVNGEDITVKGNGGRPADKCIVDCNESGSTLRFVIPIAAAVGKETEFHGRGRLPQRPIDIFTRELGKNGVYFDYHNTMPFTVSGGLKSGRFEIEGDVSSQFITGLLFALPLLEGDSEIILTSHLESRPYVDITIDTLRRFGVAVEETDDGFKVKGGQKYKPHDEKIEGDYSQAAFFCVANALGSQVELHNLNDNSVQGDKKILEIIRDMCYNGNVGNYNADCSDIPDLVPILAVLGAFGSGRSVIYNAKRLKIKESDRLETTAALLNSLGGNVTVTDDGLIIEPTGAMHGGTVDSFGDHRIVMAAAIAATAIDGEVVIKGAEAAEKSYPAFFDDYKMLGGKANVIILE
ncbi:3-phosphoshikimate 1-carboxyvinyltransferase [Ruminococcus flavefaciens]|uniref:3-phosphoshikimate 1-carboxyvinyltransferase n=1 Tax=Ruminococcus flavefaciens TaxID=1265 RepID=A0A1H6JX21_RUMFL|nr:3-phosphoshikimate 1-carboxyvinyltransferase [Ruminococcus flavefaciens]SEH65561.1 3-phosphoshikimate 1-carboxyvinyltransferase [Ruminococcus flavefaciens]